MSQEYVRNSLNLNIDHSYTLAANTNYTSIGPKYNVCKTTDIKTDIDFVNDPKETIFNFINDKIFDNNTDLINFCIFATHGKPTINSAINFITNYIKNSDFQDLIENNVLKNLIGDFCKYSEEIKFVLDFAFDKNGIKHEIENLIDDFTGTNIAELFNDFKNHASILRKTIDSTIFALDVLSYSTFINYI